MGEAGSDGEPPSEMERHRRLGSDARRVVLGPAGRQTVWREWGRGRPVVLLHGGFGSWTHWTRNIAALAATRRVLVPDTPGFGDSDLPDPVDAAEIVRSLWSDVDALVGTDTQVDLVGFSYGGGLAAEMTGRYPDRVGRLVVVGSGGMGVPLGERENLVRWRHLDAAAQRQAHRSNLKTLMFAKPEAVDDLAVALQAANTGEAKMNSKKLRGGINMPRALAGKSVVLSGIWGERDATLGGLPLALREQVIRSLDPAAEWIVLPGTGHWVQYEAAAAFNAALLGILENPRRRDRSQGRVDR